MKIVQTPVRFHPYIGGVEKYVLELSKALVGNGHDVTVVCADERPAGPSGQTDEADEVRGMHVTRLSYFTKVANTNITPRLFRELMRQRFDVIHTHIPTPWSADISALVSLIRRKPLCVTYHNDLTGDGLGAVIAGVYNRTLLHFVLRRARTIVVTQPRYVEYSSQLRRYRKKIAVIPPGVCAPRPPADRPAREPGLIFFLSVLDKHHDYKGLDVLLSAMALLRDQIPGARLVVGGGGDALDRYRDLVQRLGVADAVDFRGTLSDDEVAEAYSRSSVFALPSLNKLEGFGIVALEALTYGVPVITTNVAGSSEFIRRHDAGLIVPTGDATALAKAIERLLVNQEDAAAMGARGSAAVLGEFGWSGIAEKMAEVY